MNHWDHQEGRRRRKRTIGRKGYGGGEITKAQTKEGGSLTRMRKRREGGGKEQPLIKTFSRCQCTREGAESGPCNASFTPTD